MTKEIKLLYRKTKTVLKFVSLNLILLIAGFFIFIAGTIIGFLLLDDVSNSWYWSIGVIILCSITTGVYSLLCWKVNSRFFHFKTWQLVILIILFNISSLIFLIIELGNAWD